MCWRSIRERPRRARSSSTPTAGSSRSPSASIEQIFPRAGWVEHDPIEIWTNTQWVIAAALDDAGLSPRHFAAVGITNQRETAIVWDRRTGRPVGNAIVWQDTRTQPLIDRLAADGGTERFAATTGLPLATYFSASKIAWILDNIPGRACGRRSGAPAVRHTRHVADLESDRRHAWRHPRHRRHQRQPHAADGPRDARLVGRAARGVRHPALDAARDRAVVGCRRRSPRAARGSRHPDRGHPRRPAGGDLRAGRVRSRSVQEHLRHGQLPAGEHGHRDRALRARAGDDRGVSVRRRAGALRARRVDRGDRFARAVAARQPRHHQLRPRGRQARLDGGRQRGSVLRSRLLRTVRARTGGRMRAARWSASPAT